MCRRLYIFEIISDFKKYFFYIKKYFFLIQEKEIPILDMKSCAFSDII